MRALYLFGADHLAENLRLEEIRELQDAKGQVEVEREAVSLKYPDSFRAPAITQFVAAVRETGQLPGRLTVEEVLELRLLGTMSKGDFIPNLACALLFAKDPQLVVPGCRVRFLRYMGTVEKTGEEYNVIKDLVVDGTVPELIQNGAGIIETQIREFVKLGKDQKFYSVSEYPKPAWYEALVNACVHRSYTLKNMNI